MSELSIVRHLMAATVTDTKFLSGLKTIWVDGLVGPSWLWLASKCFEYLDQYGEAPGRNIEPVWAADTILDEETKEDIGKLLSVLSEEWEAGPKYNADHLLLEAERYFSRELYLQNAIDLEAAAEAGDLELAKEIVSRSKPKQILQPTAVNPFEDREGLAAVFREKDESLVNLGGAFQELVGSQIVSDSFVALLGKEKVGKTWILQSIVFAGMKAGTNVLFLQCGDLSPFQQRARLAVQMTGRNYKMKYNGRLLSPVPDCLRNQDGSCEKESTEGVSIITNYDSKPYPKLEKFKNALEHSPCQHLFCQDRVFSSWWEEVDPCPVLTEGEAWESYRRFNRAVGDKLRLECFSSREISVDGIRTKINQMEDSTGWVPGLVVIDYADNLDIEPGSPREYRHQINDTWEALRRLSQDRGISVVTATQAPRDTGRVLRDTDMSEDKRKKAHVTAFFGLNKDEHDKRRGWMRINPLVVREDDYDVMSQVVVFQLIQRGRPNLASFWYRRAQDD